MADAVERLKAALADRYRIERELGAGGMATVYLAEDLKHDRKVAIKVLHPELAAVLGAERFLAEIRTTANLQHPHILPLHDSGQADGLLFYVMPYVEGETLRARLEREAQLPIDVAVRITREVASALDYAHRHGVIHRDIKPENILLHEGQALIADFGIALAVSSAGRERMTQTGLSLGTPQYMSPEQAMGERAIDGRSDIYSLGCVLYEILAGEPPYTGPTAQAIHAKRVMEPPPRVSVLRQTVPGGLDATIRKALAKAAADRFGTMAQFAEALGGELPVRRAVAVTADGDPQEPQRPFTQRTLGRLIARSRLIMKNDISHLSFRTSEEIVNAVSEIVRQIPRDSDEVFLVNQGGGEITIICDANLERLLAGLQYQTIEYHPGVAILRIQETNEDDVPPGIEVPGLYAYFINQLAESNINILDMVSTRSQLTVVLAEADLMPAFSVLNERIRECRRGKSTEAGL